jgi:hypothetical protein
VRKKDWQLLASAYPVRHRPREAMATPSGYVFAQVEHRHREVLARGPWWRRLLAEYGWPPVVVLEAVHLVSIHGRGVRERTGIGRARQLREQVSLALREGIRPDYYYLYELYQPPYRSRAHEFLPRPVTKPYGIYERLYDGRPEATECARVLKDKELFSAWCTRHGLETPRVHATFASGTVTWPDPSRPFLPAQDLFVKPRVAQGGTGAEVWRFADGVYTSSKGERLDEPALQRHLEALSRGKRSEGGHEGWIAQDHLATHPDLLDLTAGALCTVRMVTCRNERGAIEHIVSILRMARDPSRVVDNCHAGGIASCVDPETGVLGPASTSQVFEPLEWFERHPVTGARIVGRKVPGWEETLKLAFRAHECLEEVPLVGWDVGITSDGPSLVEGNKKPCIDIEQRVAGPFGDGRLGQLLEYQDRRLHGPAAPTPGG